MRHWLEQSRGQLADFMAAHDHPSYRADQFWDWLHSKRADDYAAMPNLPAGLRSLLGRHGRLRALRERKRLDAADGLTVKWLFDAGGDRPAARRNAPVESVLIVEREHRRRTVCVSSMSGCPLGCVFCATGGIGFRRGLGAGEMLEQAYLADLHARRNCGGEGVSHIVFMGMGEPLLNLDAVLAAAATLADAGGLGLSGRHVTISTVGVPDGIRRLAGAGVAYRLALSLHAPDQKLREQLMPCAKKWPFDALFPALDVFAAAASRDLTFEYCLIDGVNSSPRQAKELASLLRGRRAKVNLIPLNPAAGYPGRAPGPDRVRRFRDILEDAGLPATIRAEKGREIAAACGQLGAEEGGIGHAGHSNRRTPGA